MPELWVMLFILTTGEAAYAPVERTVCEAAVRMLDAGQPVGMELASGRHVQVEAATCVPPEIGQELAAKPLG